VAFVDAVVPGASGVVWSPDWIESVSGPPTGSEAGGGVVVLPDCWADAIAEPPTASAESAATARNNFWMRLVMTAPLFDLPSATTVASGDVRMM
jgi:hypothetical protein